MSRRRGGCGGLGGVVGRCMAAGEACRALASSADCSSGSGDCVDTLVHPSPPRDLHAFGHW